MLLGPIQEWEEAHLRFTNCETSENIQRSSLMCRHVWQMYVINKAFFNGAGFSCQQDMVILEMCVSIWQIQIENKCRKETFIF